MPSLSAGRPAAGLSSTVVLVLAAVVASAGPAHGQGASWAVAGSVGMVVIEGRFGASLALGPRLTLWDRLVLSGAGELAVVGVGLDDDYEWVAAVGGEDECRRSGGATVADHYCLDGQPRVGAMVDAAISLGGDEAAQWLVGAGFRAGHATTAFGSLTVRPRRSPGLPWHGRLLIGRRYVQLHVGISSPL